MPVVIRCDHCPITVAQLQCRIAQRIGHTALRQAWSNAAHNNRVVQRSPTEDKTSDHNIVARIDEAACADVGQLGGNGRAEVIKFNQASANSVILTFQNRRVRLGGSVARMADSRSLVGAIPVA